MQLRHGRGAVAQDEVGEKTPRLAVQLPRLGRHDFGSRASVADGVGDHLAVHERGYGYEHEGCHGQSCYPNRRGETEPASLRARMARMVQVPYPVISSKAIQPSERAVLAASPREATPIFG